VDLFSLGYGPVSGFCEQGYESSGVIQGGEFIAQLSDYHISYSRRTLFRGISYSFKNKGRKQVYRAT
jgi:hypothetical protein